MLSSNSFNYRRASFIDLDHRITYKENMSPNFKFNVLRIIAQCIKQLKAK